MEWCGFSGEYDPCFMVEHADVMAALCAIMLAGFLIGILLRVENLFSERG